MSPKSFQWQQQRGQDRVEAKPSPPPTRLNRAGRGLSGWQRGGGGRGGMYLTIGKRGLGTSVLYLNCAVTSGKFLNLAKPLFPPLRNHTLLSFLGW